MVSMRNHDFYNNHINSRVLGKFLLHSCSDYCKFALDSFQGPYNAEDLNSKRVFFSCHYFSYVMTRLDHGVQGCNGSR